jgi:hypothetical protein
VHCILQNYKNKLGLEGLQGEDDAAHLLDEDSRAAKRLRLGSGGQLEGAPALKYTRIHLRNMCET